MSKSPPAKIDSPTILDMRAGNARPPIQIMKSKKGGLKVRDIVQ